MLKRILNGVGLALLLLAGYGVFIEPRFFLDDEAFEARIPNLPPGWGGQKVAVLADFQIGMWLGNTSMAEEAVEDAVGDGVALALIAGDFVYRPDSARVRRAVALMRPFVEAGIPVVAVLGNHDYSIMKESSAVNRTMAEYLEEQLEAAGVRVLQNEAVAVTVPGTADTLWVAGIGSVWAGMSRPVEALAVVPDDAARLVLMHNPESYREIPGGKAPMAFAAHTHGGQIRLFPGERNSWLDIVRAGETAADGWAAVSIGASSNRLYVNRGIGFSTVPIRINCRPELTTVTLLRAPSGYVPPRGPDATTDD